MPRASISLIVCVALLFSMGLLMVFNTTSAEIMERSLSTNVHAPLLKQLAYSFVGMLIGWLLYRWGYENFLHYSPLFLALTTVLLVCVFIPGIGIKINGARRWIGLFGAPIGQPSEIAKLLMPAAYIQWYLERKGRVDFKSFLKMLGVFSIPLLLILCEPDNGTTFVIFLMFVMLFILTKIRLSFWALPLSAFILLGGVLAYRMPHVHTRIEVYLHPELDLRGKGHQPHQAKIAAGSGKLLGRGLGESLQKLNYLPEARSDYIAAIYAEEMGFVGMLALIAIYLTLASSGFVIAIQAKESRAFLLAALLTFLISVQAFINLGVVSGLLPSKGMTLPFFSQGGSSLMINFAILFILLDIARKQRSYATFL